MEAASFDLSQAAGPSGPLSVGRNDVAIRLVEQGGSDAPFVTARLPLELAPTEFVPPGPGSGERVPALTGRSFVASGRKFVLWASVGSLPPDPTALAEANEALATLRIEPGDFYPGEVEPATFAAAPGWYTGTSAPAQVEPDGEQTSSWASTVPNRDPPNRGAAGVATLWASGAGTVNRPHGPRGSLLRPPQEAVISRENVERASSDTILLGARRHVL